MNTQLLNLIISNPKRAAKNKYIGSIYVLENSINNKIYIGQTIQWFLKRWTNHKNNSNRSDMLISRAIAKYGFDKFNKYVIFQTDEVSNKKEIRNLLNAKEIEYIALFDSTNKLIGYNITKGGDGTYGYKHSPEKIQKMKLTRTGKYNNPKLCEKIYLYNLDFELIKVWPSNAEIRRIYGIQIEFDLNKFTFYNFIWVRERDNNLEYLNKFKERAEQLKLIKNSKAVLCKWILQFDFKGNLIQKYPSAKYAADLLQCDQSLITGAANGKCKQAKGYIWIYLNDFSLNILDQKLEDVKSTLTYKQMLLKSDDE